MKIASQERRESNLILLKWGLDITGHVLSIGSAGDSDKQGGYYRQYFPKATSYTTSEVEYTSGCDLVLDVRHCPEVRDSSYHCLFCSGVLEHVDEYQTAISEMWRILKPGGVLLLGVPFMQPEHRRPNDFRRFTQDGIRYDLTRMGSRFTVEEIKPLGDPARALGYWVRARK